VTIHLKTITALFVALAFCVSATAQVAAPQQTLITNARIFDGKSDKLANGMSVLIKGKKITKIAKNIMAPTGASVIDAAGCMMTPGNIELCGTAGHVGQTKFENKEEIK